MSATKQLTVAVDFDGVLHRYTRGWTGVKPLEPPVNGARGFVEGLIRSGFRVVVMSVRARDAKGRKAIKAWLSEHQFPPLEVTSEKIGAVIYVDDRGCRFDPRPHGAKLEFARLLAFIRDPDSRESWCGK